MEKRFETINVSKTTYRKAMEIGKRMNLPGSFVIRAYIEYFLKSKLRLRLIENPGSEKVYPLKVKKEMKEKIRKRAEVHGLSVKTLVDLIFLNIKDSEKPLKAATERMCKLPKGDKFYILRECFRKNIDYLEAARIAKTTYSYAARAYRTFRKELRDVQEKEEK
ncbi:hypothetical protein [Desulfurobacterium sp. TC5-1]|uniref:hypothetical protein n=1 Tax=Desulfurobacterium sp. TC5-1 TaxID=1158318 RepID=UPI0003B466B6|nr:hypothetical protein [Desulfurobacterium sp. TC5-1]